MNDEADGIRSVNYRKKINLKRAAIFAAEGILVLFFTILFFSIWEKYSFLAFAILPLYPITTIATDIFGIALGNFVSYSLSFAWFWLILYLLVYRKLNQKLAEKYLPCPYDDCNKSILVYEKWQCDNCNKYQKTERYITDKCKYCGRILDTVFCEHCHQEIKLS